MRFKIVSAGLFHHAITTAKNNNIKYGATLEAFTVEEYAKECICFLCFDGDYYFGYAIKRQGSRYTQLISVFKHPNIPGRVGNKIIDHAVNNGAKELICFDTISYIYEAKGFRTIHTNKFDAKLAGPDWNYSLLGRPSVNVMILTNS